MKKKKGEKKKKKPLKIQVFQQREEKPSCLVNIGECKALLQELNTTSFFSFLNSLEGKKR